MRSEQVLQRQTVGIVGFGNFGQFWARVLSADHAILVTDRRDVTEQAAAIGARAVNLADLCRAAQVIFLCVPINQVEATVQEVAPLVQPGTLVMDTCSVKVHPAQVFERYLADRAGVETVLTHPMFGPDSGANGIAGLPIMLAPLNVAPGRFNTWKDYFAGLGLRIVEMSPEEHDRLSANSQGITHYIGRVLDSMDLTETPIDTTGYKKLLSVIEQTCNDTWELFHDLQNYNPYTQEMRLRLEGALDRVYSALLPEQVAAGELVVGIQGGKGSFNEEACHHYCATHAIDAYRIEYLYTSENVLAALHRGEVDRGVFAIQNAQGGVVMETIHALSQYACEIIEIFEIVVNHCILHHPETPFEAVDTLISHPQALAQCRETLAARYPHLRLISGEGDLIDQAYCAQRIAEGAIPPTTAVLASQICSALYGLRVHDVGLQDLGANNLTTFVWVKRRHYFR